MPEFISKKDQDFLKEKFDKDLTKDVTISLFTQRETRLTLPGVDPQQSEYCASANQLMREVSALSDKIHLEMYDFTADPAKAREYKIDKIPAMVLEGGEDGAAPRFFGLPAGYEFSTFLQDILDISNGSIALSEEGQQAIKSIDEAVHIQVFTTPT